MQIITAVQKAKSDIKAAREELEELEYSWPEELLAQSFLNNTPNYIAMLRKKRDSLILTVEECPAIFSFP